MDNSSSSSSSSSEGGEPKLSQGEEQKSQKCDQIAEGELPKLEPKWLNGFLETTFFDPCPIHGHQEDKELSKQKWYCILCDTPHCAYCLLLSCPHIQDDPDCCLRIYQHNDRICVRFDKIQPHFDCAAVQAFSSGKDELIPLKPVVQKKHAREEAGERNSQSIQCDLPCKVEAIMKKAEDSPLDNQPLQEVTAEEEINKKYDQIAEVRWVNRFLRTRFFEPCPTHNEKEMKEQRWYCIGCEAPHCGHCLIRSCPHISLTEDPSKTCLRIYRHDHRIAVRFDKFHPHFNCSGIQTYVSDKDVLIALHPVQDKRAGEGNCRTCTRSLIQLGKFRYCCLSCKVEASTKKEDDDALVRNANSESQLSKTATKVTEMPPDN